MASTSFDRSFFTLDHQIESLKNEIKKQVETVDRLSREKRQTGDATRHLDSLLQQYMSLVVARREFAH
jgi:hypothetical protein